MQSQNEIRKSITDRLVAALKSGSNIPWRRPWRILGPHLPTNHVTGRAYNGINILTLWLAAQEKGFPVDLWASFDQWKSIGASVTKGEKAERIVFYSQVKKYVTDESDDDRVKTFPILRTWSVFNISQVSGDAVEKFQKHALESQFTGSMRDEFDRVVAATKADIHYGGDKAFYRRLPDDYIQMPSENRFESFPSFAEVLSHELLHWSEFRVGWSEEYALSELRAEIGACFLTAATGVPDSGDLTNHAKYVESWLRALDNDPRFIFQASSAASKGADFILSFSRKSAESIVEESLEEITA